MRNLGGPFDTPTATIPRIGIVAVGVRLSFTLLGQMPSKKHRRIGQPKVVQRILRTVQHPSHREAAGGAAGRSRDFFGQFGRGEAMEAQGKRLDAAAAEQNFSAEGLAVATVVEVVGEGQVAEGGELEEPDLERIVGQTKEQVGAEPAVQAVVFLEKKSGVAGPCASQFVHIGGAELGDVVFSKKIYFL